MIRPYIAVLFIFLMMNSCKQTQSISTNVIPSFDKQGHRGCRGLMPENTIPAMLKAFELGVTTLEMDVCISKDNQVLLSHEPFFNHEITTLPNGKFISEAEEHNFNLYSMDYDSIKKYDIGLKPHPRFTQQQKLASYKPLLSDVFEAIKKAAALQNKPIPFFNIETKTTPETDNVFHPAPKPFVDLLMKEIKQYNMEKYVIIQSFDNRTLKYLHKKNPSIQTALLIEETDKRSIRKQLDDLGFIPNIYSPNYNLVTDNLIETCHSKGIRIIPWTVNNEKEITRLKAMKVDGIISDYPNLF